MSEWANDDSEIFETQLGGLSFPNFPKKMWFRFFHKKGGVGKIGCFTKRESCPITYFYTKLTLSNTIFYRVSGGS